jgi:4-diphosphocytidyl-2-C-methyl-D-erythritol kinase
MTRSITMQCPSKVNLFLDITAKRTNGYHEISTLFLPIDQLFDTLVISESSSGMSIACDHPGVPCDEKNLIWQVAQSFADRVKIKAAWHFDLSKRIPVAGGMAGGSSNAASTLMGLNELYRSPLSNAELAEIAVKHGADIAFFFEQSPARAEGIGEVLKPVPIQQDLYLLFIPFSFPISAVWAYKNRLGDFNSAPMTLDEVLEQINKGIVPQIFNDLAPAVRQKFPIIDLACKQLIENGAITAEVSGSGPTVFALFKSAEERDQGLKELQPNFPETLIAADYNF